DRVFVGMQKGLKALRRQDGQWIDEGSLPGVDEEINHILETPDGQLWLTARFNGLIRVDGSYTDGRDVVLTRFDTTHGLPDMERNVAFMAGRTLRFTTTAGVYRFDKEGGRFVPDT